MSTPGERRHVERLHRSRDLAATDQPRRRDEAAGDNAGRPSEEHGV